LDAIQGIDSDYEQRRVVSTLLKQRGLTAADAAMIVDGTSSIDSDYERGEVLKQVSSSLDFSQPALQQAYLKAASEIESDHELRQALSALLKQQRVNPAALDLVLNAVTTIDSDYEQTEVLLEVLKNHTLTSAQKARVAKITESIGSDHDRGRVSAMLLRQLTN
jgi:hypothetical protein